MKIRNGFVSNSSSSSFVIFGQRTTIKEAEKHVRNGENVIATVEGWEGPIVIDINSLELLSYVYCMEQMNRTVYDVYVAYSWGFDGDGGNDVDLSTLPKNGTAVLSGGYCDQFYIDNMTDMEEFFSDDWSEAKEKAKSIFTKYLRKEKLKEIKENE